MADLFDGTIYGAFGNLTLNDREMRARIRDWQRSRNTDPPTSRAAARSVRETAAHHATLIIGALKHPATATEIAEYTGLDPVQVCRRLTELERLGVIRPTGATRKTASGRQSREWERVKHE